jgi:hypothetical protein
MRTDSSFDPFTMDPTMTAPASHVPGAESPYFDALVRGLYADVVTQAVDRDAALAAADVPWVVGALGFVGRTSEAEGLLSAWLPRLEGTLKLAARFYLGEALCREGQCERSAKLLRLNLAEARRDVPLERFFVTMGFGFFRYTTGRIRLGELWAKAAVKAAAAAGFAYGSALALELLGHAQLMHGQVHAGLRSLDLAQAKARALGQRGALAQAFEASRTLYRATYGLAPAPEIAGELDARVAACDHEDSYTKAALQTELARVDLLRGAHAAAKARLEQTSVLVYRVDNPELEVNYDLCLAEVYRRAGDLHQALHVVRAACFRARSRPHSSLTLLRALGLEAALLRQLGREAEARALAPQIVRATRQSGGWIARRLAARSGELPAADFRRGEDPLGDLLEACAAKDPAAVETAIARGWLGLLQAAVGLPAAERVVCFDLVPGGVTLLDRGEVRHVASGCSALMRKFMGTLAHGETSKETLAVALWGRAYNPLRHDGLIYNLVAKTRRLLGERGAWIEASEIGYRLAHGVTLLARDLRRRDRIVLAPAAIAPEREAARPRETAAPRRADARLSALNIRQLTVLEWLQAREAVDPRLVIERLKVSDATATRDLTGLVQLGMARRVGRGRATSYVLGDAGRVAGSPVEGGSP